MALATWDPFRELNALHREIDHLFSEIDRRWSWPFSRTSFLPGRASRAYPLLRVSEDENNIYVEALAPGLDTDSLKVSVVQDQLRIEGRKPEPADVKPEQWHRNERAAGSFIKTFRLPTPVKADQVSAEYRSGLLRITLPKADEARPRLIDVRLG